MANYKIFCPKNRGLFSERIEELTSSVSQWLAEESLQGRSMRFSKVFLSDAQNQYSQYEVSKLHGILSSSATTVVEQPPTDGSKIAVLITTSDHAYDILFDSLRLKEEESIGLDSYQQATVLFERYIKNIEAKGLDIKTHLIRTWIYVSDIDTNYQGVVNARNYIFAKHGMTAETHFVASTGIGGNTDTRSASVAIDFLTYPSISEEHKKYLQALDHLNPTHEYGVAFERGTKLSLGNEEVYYISGTASIDDKGQVVYLGNVERQAERLLDNIEALLKNGGATINDVKYFTVYLRDLSDHCIIDNFMKSRFPSIPYIIVLAKVCRPQWLIEMECVARR